MRPTHFLLFPALFLTFLRPAFAAVDDRTWQIDGVKRSGIVCTPESGAAQPPEGWPLVFVFHGHGGNAQQIRRQFQTDTLWPGAVVVYLQGLPTVGQLTDPQGNRAGWDCVSEPEKNKDIKLYDAVLKDLIEHEHVDSKRVFSTGHSNGGGFTFALWAHRGDTLAGVASSSSIARPADWPLLKPKPAMMSGGRNDPLVKFEWQSKMIEQLKSVNGISGEGKPWGEGGLWYNSDHDTPLATIIHDGGHAPPKGLGARIVEFFKTVSPERSK